MRSFHCSAPGPATTGAQGRPRSDRDDLPMSLDHFRKPSRPAAGTTGHQEDGRCDGYTLPHPVWSEEELNSVQITHTPPEKPVDTVHSHTTLTNYSKHSPYSPAGCLLLCADAEDGV